MRKVPPLVALAVLASAGIPCAGALNDAQAQEKDRFAFDRIVIDDDFPGGYQVEVADVNGDGKPDLVALGGDVCAWYENPTWKKRVITTAKEAPGVISSATVDLDGDGRAEIALAHDFEMNQPKRGKLSLAVQGGSVDDPWMLIPIDDIGSIHRVRWGDLDGDGKLDLIVAPIFGREASPPTYKDPARLIAYTTIDARDPSRWTRRPLTARPVTHAIEFHPTFGQIQHPVLLAADNQGVTLIGPITDEDLPDRPLAAFDLVPGAAGDQPKRGASEIHVGRYKDGRLFLATLEPWHGSDVVVWPQKEAEGLDFGPRVLIDDSLNDGHALWVADLDGDGQDEVIAGHRGKDHRVSIYDYDAEADAWRRSIIDREVAAQDLRGGDLNGDGKPDFVAIGGSTHNLILYQSK